MQEISLPSPRRTDGDGMENVTPAVAKQEKSGGSLVSKLLYNPQELNSYSPAPPAIPSKIFNLVPKKIPHMKKDKFFDSLHSKEPKFVPYEPYKAAVKPMMPPRKKEKSERKISKSSISTIPDLSIDMLDMNLCNVKETCLENKNEKTSDAESDWELEKKSMQQEIKRLKEENQQLENQLKFQAQVNGELKTLLVAAVGEDMEVKVNILTEDKLQLAQALLNSSQKLSSHQEQTEWLAGQCEVWRSKFLASSLMVEELARWKAALSQKTTDLQEAMKRLLEERRSVRESLLHATRILSVLYGNFEHGTSHYDLPSSNIVDLATYIKKLADKLSLQLLSGHNWRVCQEPDFTGLDMSTVAERIAENLLSSPNNIFMPDAVCTALLGAAVAVGSHGLPASCCAHCRGEIKLV